MKLFAVTSQVDTPKV